MLSKLDGAFPTLVSRSMKFPQCHSSRYRHWTRRIQCNWQSAAVRRNKQWVQLVFGSYPSKNKYTNTETTTCQPRRLPITCVCVFVMNLFAYQSSKFQRVPSLIPFNTSSLMFLQIENQLLLWNKLPRRKHWKCLVCTSVIYINSAIHPVAS